MKRFALAAFVAAVTLAPANVWASGISMQVYASSAPNVFGSPSWPGYVANAISGIDNGGVATGTPGTPEFYESGGPFTAGDFVVSSYNTWKGDTNPAAPFGGEYGNRMHFGLKIEALGMQFHMADVTFDMHSSDPGDSFVFAGNYAASVFGPDRVGIDYGGDGVRGGGDDIVYNSGETSDKLIKLVPDKRSG